MKRKELKISNALIFAEVMKNKEFCKETLNRIIPDREVEELVLVKPEESDTYLRTEDVIEPQIDSKGIRVDVRFKDSNAWYAIEMQVEDEYNLPKRSRYIHSAMDVDELNKGGSYNELRPSYVIFICRFDYFRKHRSRYCFSSYDMKNRLQLGDERYTIVLNTKDIDESIPEKLTSLIRYINEGVIDKCDEFIVNMDNEVKTIANSDIGREIMTVEEYYEIRAKSREQKAIQEGIKEGVKEGSENTVLNLFNKGAITLEDACDELHLTVDAFQELVSSRAASK